MRIVERTKVKAPTHCLQGFKQRFNSREITTSRASYSRLLSLFTFHIVIQHGRLHGVVSILFSGDFLYRCETVWARCIYITTVIITVIMHRWSLKEQFRNKLSTSSIRALLDFQERIADLHRYLGFQRINLGNCAAVKMSAHRQLMRRRQGVHLFCLTAHAHKQACRRELDSCASISGMRLSDQSNSSTVSCLTDQLNL